ncbi:hypothetical protein JTE90_005690, partial [Oedothorax gibbosus]
LKKNPKVIKEVSEKEFSKICPSNDGKGRLD